jgi:hypothetical protein
MIGSILDGNNIIFLFYFCKASGDEDNDYNPTKLTRKGSH